MSGGASANWIAPAAGLSLADKQAVTRALLRSGADIGEINTVRKHLSRIKGGRLARARRIRRASSTLAISDVPGDDPAVIGSGPTVPDPTHARRRARDRRAITSSMLPDAVTRALDDPANESPKPGDPVFADTEFTLIARPADALRAAEAAVRAAGYECVMLGDRIEGEAREVAADARRARARACSAQGRRAVILSGGELTVTIRGQGRGGPNQEYALALAIGARRRARHRGARRRHRRHRRRRRRRRRPGRRLRRWRQPLARARALGLDPAAFLADNNSTGFFDAAGRSARHRARPTPT